MSYESESEELLQLAKSFREDFGSRLDEELFGMLIEAKWNMVKQYDSYFKQNDRPIPCELKYSSILIKSLLTDGVLADFTPSNPLAPLFDTLNEATNEIEMVVAHELWKFYQKILSEIENQVTELAKQTAKQFENAFALFEHKYNVYFIPPIAFPPPYTIITEHPIYTALVVEVQTALYKRIMQWLLPKPTIYRCALAVKEEACRTFDVELFARYIREFMDNKYEKVIRDLETWLRESKNKATS